MFILISRVRYHPAETSIPDNQAQLLGDHVYCGRLQCSGRVRAVKVHSWKRRLLCCWVPASPLGHPPAIYAVCNRCHRYAEKLRDHHASKNTDGTYRRGGKHSRSKMNMKAKVFVKPEHPQTQEQKPLVSTFSGGVDPLNEASDIELSPAKSASLV